jgi:hypothetical protein
MLIPMPIPVRGDAGTVAIVARPIMQARSPLRFSFPSADVDVAVSHGLGRAPEGYIVVGRSAGVTVYNGSASSSEDLLVLRATGAAEVDVLPL